MDAEELQQLIQKYLARTASPAEQERLDKFVHDFLSSGVLKDARSLFINTCGEIFVSKSCRTLLMELKKEQYPNLALEIITNGQLCNRKAFDSLHLWKSLFRVTVSIDAATAETYRVVRRGGDFGRLLANLEFLDHIRADEGEVFTLLLRFVVSALNFREMPAFVELAKRFHAVVDFTFLRNHGSFSLEELKRLDMSNPGHPDYAEFLKILEGEQLLDPCVNWCDLGHLKPEKVAPAAGSAA